jgi:hypothetical protein
MEERSGDCEIFLGALPIPLGWEKMAPGVLQPSLGSEKAKLGPQKISLGAQETNLGEIEIHLGWRKMQFACI